MGQEVAVWLAALVIVAAAAATTASAASVPKGSGGGTQAREEKDYPPPRRLDGAQVEARNNHPAKRAISSHLLLLARWRRDTDDQDNGEQYEPTGNGSATNGGGGGVSVNSTLLELNAFEAARLGYFRFSPLASVVLAAAYSCVFVIGLVGNSFVVALVCKSPRMRTVTNYFIVNLAFADILVLVFCLPATLLSNMFLPYVLGLFVCKTVSYLQGVAVSASINTMVTVTLDRFLAICFPLDWHMTRRAARWVIAGIWLFSLCISAPWAMYFKLIPYPLEPTTSIQLCTEDWPDERFGKFYFLFANLILLYLFPAIVITLCYLGMWYKIKRRNIPGDRPKGAPKIELIMQKSKIKVIKMMMVVVIMFLLSWLPTYIIFARVKLVEERSSLEDTIIRTMMPLAQWLGASNSCINPVLYSFFNRKYKRGFADLFRFAFCCCKSSPTNHLQPGATGLVRLDGCPLSGSGIAQAKSGACYHHHHHSKMSDGQFYYRNSTANNRNRRPPTEVNGRGISMQTMMSRNISSSNNNGASAATATAASKRQCSVDQVTHLSSSGNGACISTSSSHHEQQQQHQRQQTVKNSNSHLQGSQANRNEDPARSGTSRAPLLANLSCLGRQVGLVARVGGSSGTIFGVRATKRPTRRRAATMPSEEAAATCCALSGADKKPLASPTVGAAATAAFGQETVKGDAKETAGMVARIGGHILNRPSQTPMQQRAHSHSHAHHHHHHHRRQRQRERTPFKPLETTGGKRRNLSSGLCKFGAGASRSASSGRSDVKSSGCWRPEGAPACSDEKFGNMIAGGGTVGAAMKTPQQPQPPLQAPQREAERRRRQQLACKEADTNMNSDSGGGGGDATTAATAVGANNEGSRNQSVAGAESGERKPRKRRRAKSESSGRLFGRKWRAADRGGGEQSSGSSRGGEGVDGAHQTRDAAPGAAQLRVSEGQVQLNPQLGKAEAKAKAKAKAKAAAVTKAAWEAAGEIASHSNVGGARTKATGKTMATKAAASGGQQADSCRCGSGRQAAASAAAAAAGGKRRPQRGAKRKRRNAGDRSFKSNSTTRDTESTDMTAISLTNGTTTTNTSNTGGCSGGGGAATAPLAAAATTTAPYNCNKGAQQQRTCPSLSAARCLDAGGGCVLLRQQQAETDYDEADGSLEEYAASHELCDGPNSGSNNNCSAAAATSDKRNSTSGLNGEEGNGNDYHERSASHCLGPAGLAQFELDGRSPSFDDNEFDNVYQGHDYDDEEDDDDDEDEVEEEDEDEEEGEGEDEEEEEYDDDDEDGDEGDEEVEEGGNGDDYEDDERNFDSEEEEEGDMLFGCVSNESCSSSSSSAPIVGRGLAATGTRLVSLAMQKLVHARSIPDKIAQSNPPNHPSHQRPLHQRAKASSGFELLAGGCRVMTKLATREHKQSQQKHQYPQKQQQQQQENQKCSPLLDSFPSPSSSGSKARSGAATTDGIEYNVYYVNETKQHHIKSPPTRPPAPSPAFAQLTREADDILLPYKPGESGGRLDTLSSSTSRPNQNCQETTEKVNDGNSNNNKRRHQDGQSSVKTFTCSSRATNDSPKMRQANIPNGVVVTLKRKKNDKTRPHPPTPWDSHL